MALMTDVSCEFPQCLCVNVAYCLEIGNDFLLSNPHLLIIMYLNLKLPYFVVQGLLQKVGSKFSQSRNSVFLRNLKFPYHFHNSIQFKEHC